MNEVNTEFEEIAADLSIEAIAQVFDECEEKEAVEGE